MNKVILMGRLTRDPNVRYTQQNGSQESMCVARYTLAVDRTGSYTNRDGQKVYTTDVVIEEQEFAESKKAAGEQAENAGYTDTGDGFMSIPDGIDGDLPFM